MKNKKLDSLQSQKMSLQLQLNNLLNASIKDYDKINELKADILYLDKQISKIVGKKEMELQNELKNKKSHVEEINKTNYYNLKFSVKKINPMVIATNRIIGVLDSLENENIDEKVRVKV